MNNLAKSFETANEIDFINLLISLFLCVLLSFITSYVYRERSGSLSNKLEISKVIPILSITTFLVISVVKSSLALSLGLVGALSVIRFRTPIKSPEDLIYLFISISIGLGFGAGQITTTILVFICLMLVILFFYSKKKEFHSDYNLIIEGNDNEGELLEKYEDIINVVKLKFNDVHFIKYDRISNGKVILVFKVSVSDHKKINELNTELSKSLKNFNLNFYENSTVL